MSTLVVFGLAKWPRNVSQPVERQVLRCLVKPTGKLFTFFGGTPFGPKGQCINTQGNDLMEIPIKAPKHKKLWYSNNKYHRSQKRHISTKPDFSNGTCKNMFSFPPFLGSKILSVDKHAVHHLNVCSKIIHQTAKTTEMKWRKKTKSLSDYKAIIIFGETSVNSELRQRFLNVCSVFF